MKNRILSITCLLFLLAGCASNSGNGKSKNDITLRILFGSDVHLKNTETVEDARLKKAFETAYDYASKQEYKTVDAAVFSGDIANTGSEIQFRKFFDIVNESKKEETTVITTIGNHELDFCEEEDKNPVDLFRQYGQCEEDYHTMVNGYHFIELCPSTGKSYSDEKKAWLDTELAKAVAADPDKPVFVTEHHPVNDTVYGSFDDPSGLPDLQEVLFKYPNVVNLTGHSHFSIMDPRSLYQGEITAINGGSMSYPSFAINECHTHDVYPVDQFGRYRFTGTGYQAGCEIQILEVHEDTSMDVIGFDLLNDRQLFTRHLESTVDKTKFVTNEQKKNAYKVFEWNEGDEASLFKANDENIEMIFPQIETTTDEIIESYRAIVFKDDQEVFRGYALSNYMQAERPDTIIISIGEIEVERGDYHADIYAVNPYNVTSLYPISVDFSY